MSRRLREADWSLNLSTSQDVVDRLSRMLSRPRVAQLV